MDARDLAPAMLATARLFEHSAALMYGSTTAIKIEVNADFRRGSFSYDIVARAVALAQTLYEHISVSDIILTGTTLIAALKYARGRQPKEILRDGSTANIVFHDGDNITVNVQTANLFLNPSIREDLEGVVEPLKKEGIDTFILCTRNQAAS